MNEMIGNEGGGESRSSVFFHIAYAMAVIAAALVFFCFGYSTGLSSSAAPAMSQQTAAEAVEERNAYIVCVKNGKLCIYERSREGESLIASERVSTEVFPSSDRERLEEGIEFETMAQAQAVFEDFVN